MRRLLVTPLLFPLLLLLLVGARRGVVAVDPVECTSDPRIQFDAPILDVPTVERFVTSVSIRGGNTGILCVDAPAHTVTVDFHIAEGLSAVWGYNTGPLTITTLTGGSTLFTKLRLAPALAQPFNLSATTTIHGKTITNSSTNFFVTGPAAIVVQDWASVTTAAQIISSPFPTAYLLESTGLKGNWDERQVTLGVKLLDASATLLGTVEVLADINGTAVWTDISTTKANYTHIAEIYVVKSPEVYIRKQFSIISTPNVTSTVYFTEPTGYDGSSTTHLFGEYLDTNWTTQPVIHLLDEYGNVVDQGMDANSTAEVRVRRNTTEFDVFSPRQTWQFLNGILRFQGAKISENGTYTMNVTSILASNSAKRLSAISKAFDIYTLADQVLFTTPPTGNQLHAPSLLRGASVGFKFDVQPAVQIFDRWGDPVTRGYNAITTVLGNVTALNNASDYIALTPLRIWDLQSGALQFESLTIGRNGTFQFVVTVFLVNGSSLSVVSRPFDILEPRIISAHYNVQPTGRVPNRDYLHGAYQRVPFQIQPILELRDAFGQVPTSGPDSTARVTTSLVAIMDASGVVGLTDNVIVPSKVWSCIGGKLLYADVQLNTYGRFVFHSSIYLSNGTVLDVASDPFNVSFFSPPTSMVWRENPLALSVATSTLNAPVNLQVFVRDSFGNGIDTMGNFVKLSIGVNPGGGVLTGQLIEEVDHRTGVATFAVSVDKIGVGYRLHVELLSIVPDTVTNVAATGNLFSIVLGPPDTIAFTVQPLVTGATGGTPLPRQPVVTVFDAGRNLIDNSDTLAGTVTLKLNGSAVPIGGTPVATLINGVALFTDLYINLPGVYVMHALLEATESNTAYTKETLSVQFVVSVGPLDQISFVYPMQEENAGVLFQQQPILRFFDRGGNQFNDNDTLAVIKLTDASSSLGQELFGNKTVRAHECCSNFTDLYMNTPGTYQLFVRAFRYGVNVTTTSNLFNVVPGVGESIGYTILPPTIVTGNVSFPVQMEVVLKDKIGNPATGDSKSTISLKLVNTNRDGVLRGNINVTLVNGIAQFPGVRIAPQQFQNHLNQISYLGFYQIEATSSLSGVASIQTNVINVIVGPATRLNFIQTPSGGPAGVIWSVQPMIQIRDEGYNVVTHPKADENAVFVLLTDPENPTSTTVATTLIGNRRQEFVNGTATYVGMSATVPDPTYQLLGELEAKPEIRTYSNNFTVATGPPVKMTFVLQPPSPSVGNILWNSTLQPRLRMQDKEQNPAEDDFFTKLNISLVVIEGNGVLHGNTFLQVQAGWAIFTDLYVSGLGQYQIRAVADSGQLVFSILSNIFVVTYGDPLYLQIESQPAINGTAAGELWAKPPRLSMRDAGGNVVSRLFPNVQLFATLIDKSNASAVLRGSVNISFVGGYATFTDLIINEPGNYSLLFESREVDPSTLAPIANSAVTNFSVTSDRFEIRVGRAHYIVSETVPTVEIGSQPWDTQPVFTLRDAAWNLVFFDSETKVSLSVINETADAAGRLGKLEGPTTITASQGYVRCQGLFIRILNQYRIIASIQGLPAGKFINTTTSSFRIIFGSIDHLYFAQEPLPNNTAGEEYSVSHQPVIHFLDEGNNLVLEHHTADVFVSIRSLDTNRLYPNLTSQTVSVGGISSFRNMSWNLVGLWHYEVFVSLRTDPATFNMSSTPFFVTRNDLHSIRWIVQPQGGKSARVLDRMPSIAAYDRFGNLLYDDVRSDATLTLIPLDGAGGVMTGTKQLLLSHGIATFSNLIIDKIGEYRMHVSLRDPQSGITVTNTSVVIVVIFSPPQQIFSNRNPRGSPIREFLSRQPSFRVYDEGSNLLTRDLPATIHLLSETFGCSQGLGLLTAALNGNTTEDRPNGICYQNRDSFLLGNATRLFRNGFIDWNDSPLSVSTQGSYILVIVTLDKDKTIYSATPRFSMVYPVPSAVRFVTQPVGGVSMQPWTQSPTVELLDRVGHRILLDNTTTIILSLHTDIVNPTQPPRKANPIIFYGRATLTLGLAVWPQLHMDKSGTYTFHALAPELGLSTISNDFQIAVGIDERLVFWEQPGTQLDNQVFLFPPVLAHVDLGYNVVTKDSSSSVHINLTHTPFDNDEFGRPVGLWTGNFDVKMQRGLASYKDNGLKLNTVGQGYRLTAWSTPDNSTLQTTGRSYVVVSELFNVDLTPVIDIPYPVGNATEALVWISGTMGPATLLTGTAFVASTAVIAGAPIMARGGATFRTSVTSSAFSTSIHALTAYAVYLQMFIVPIEHNAGLIDVFELTHPLRRFQGNLDDSNTEYLFAYAHSLVGKGISIGFVALVMLLSPRMQVQTCCNEFTLYGSMFIPFMLLMYNPINESIVESRGDVLPFIFTYVIGACLLFFLFVVWLVAQHQFNKRQRYVRARIPKGRGNAALCFHPTGFEEENEWLQKLKNPKLNAATREKYMNLYLSRKRSRLVSSRITRASDLVRQRTKAKLGRAIEEAAGLDELTLEDIEDEEQQEVGCCDRARENLRSLTCTFSCHHPKSTFMNSRKRLETKKIREETVKAQELGLTRNDEFDREMKSIEVWNEFFFRPMYEQVVMYGQRKRMPGCVGWLRQHVAHHFQFVKLAYQIIFVVLAIAHTQTEQLFYLTSCCVAYFLMMVVLMPYKNPFLQQELVFTVLLAVQLTVLMAVLDAPDRVWILLVVMITQVLMVPIHLLIGWRFKELPERAIPEYVDDDTFKRGLVNMGSYAENVNSYRSGMYILGEDAIDDKRLAAEELDLNKMTTDADNFLRMAHIHWKTGGKYRTDTRFCYTYFGNALKLYRKIKRFREKQAVCLTYLGHIHIMLDDEKTAALRFYRTALKLYPSCEEAGLALAGYFLEENQHAQALRIYDKAVMSAKTPDEAEWAVQQRAALNKMLNSTGNATAESDSTMFGAGQFSSMASLYSKNKTNFSFDGEDSSEDGDFALEMTQLATNTASDENLANVGETGAPKEKEKEKDKSSRKKSSKKKSSKKKNKK